MIASLALHGRVVSLGLVVSCWSKPRSWRYLSAARILKKLTRKANKSRKIVAKHMRNMHVPAYCPVVFGEKAVDQRGVFVEVKNTIAISSMPIIPAMSDDDVDVGMGLESVAEPVDIAIAIELESMSMSMLVIRRIRTSSVCELCRLVCVR